MKFIPVLFTLYVAVSAIPYHRHNHQSGDVAPAAAPAPAVQPATEASVAGTPDTQQADGGRHRGGHHGGNQGGNGAPPAAAPPAAAQTPAASSGNGQATTPANQGQGSNTGQTTGSIDQSLVPQFGQQAGLQPDGTGNCKADSGKVIPCQCPPDRTAFIDKLGQFVAAGVFPNGISAPFPTDGSAQSQLTRINTIISALQNFDGKPGVGCPAASAPNFAVVQCAAIKATGAVCNGAAGGG